MTKEKVEALAIICNALENAVRELNSEDVDVLNVSSSDGNTNVHIYRIYELAEKIGVEVCRDSEFLEWSNGKANKVYFNYLGVRFFGIEYIEEDKNNESH